MSGVVNVNEKLRPLALERHKRQLYRRGDVLATDQGEAGDNCSRYKEKKREASMKKPRSITPHTKLKAEAYIDKDEGGVNTFHQ